MMIYGSLSKILLLQYSTLPLELDCWLTISAYSMPLL